MASDILEGTKDRMHKTIAVLKSELGGLRAGRANAQLLDRILVDYYGTPTPIPQLGNVSTPEPRMLLISVWDTKAIPAVEKAIQKSDLGINPSNDGKVIRLLFPELNEERRKELVKVVKKKGEESKDEAGAHDAVSLPCHPAAAPVDRRSRPRRRTGHRTSSSPR